MPVSRVKRSLKVHQSYFEILSHYVVCDTVYFGQGLFSLSLILMLFCLVSICVPIENDFRVVEISSLIFLVYLLFLLNYLERFISYVYVCMSVCIPCACRKPQRAEEGVVCPGTKVTGSCELPRGC